MGDGSWKMGEMIPKSTREAAARCVQLHAAAAARLNELIAERDVEMARVQRNYAAIIEPLQGEITKLEEQLECWSGRYRKELFGEGQSVELPCGFLKYRNGPPKLETRSGWDWGKVVSKLVSLGKRGSWARYLKREPVVDKVLLLKDAKGEKPRLTEEQLASVGLKLISEERFFVEAKPAQGKS